MGVKFPQKKYESKDDSVLEQRSKLDILTCDGLDSEDEEEEDVPSPERKPKRSNSNENSKAKKGGKPQETPKQKEQAIRKTEVNPIYEDINDSQAYFQDDKANFININDPFPFDEGGKSSPNKEIPLKQEKTYPNYPIVNQQKPEAFFSSKTEVRPADNKKPSPQPVIKKETYAKVSEEDLHFIVECMKKCEARYQMGMKAVQDNNYPLAVGIFTKTKQNILKLSNIIKGKTHLPKDFSHSIITKLIEKSNKVNLALTQCMPYALKQKISTAPMKAVPIPQKKAESKVRGKSNPKPSSNKKPLDDEAKQAFEDKIEGEILIKDPGIKFSDIVGMNDLKQILREIVFLPLERPELFTGLRQPLRGLLLFGPPGTGKTMIAKAMASECKSTFFNISASSLTSKWIGESEKTVRALFQLAYKKSPAIIFIDEIESILSKRSDNDNEAAKRLKTEFLVQFDGLSSSTESKLLVVAATNRPLDLDDALLRRLPKKIYCGPLDLDGRVNFVQTVMKSVDNKLTEADLKLIAKQTNNYSNSDLKELCREASYEPIRELTTQQIIATKKLRDIELKDFTKALNRIRGTITDAMLDELKKWNTQFGALSI